MFVNSLNALCILRMDVRVGDCACVGVCVCVSARVCGDNDCSQFCLLLGR